MTLSAIPILFNILASSIPNNYPVYDIVVPDNVIECNSLISVPKLTQNNESATVAQDYTLLDESNVFEDIYIRVVKCEKNVNLPLNNVDYNGRQYNNLEQGSSITITHTESFNSKISYEEIVTSHIENSSVLKTSINFDLFDISNDSKLSAYIDTSLTSKTEVETTNSDSISITFHINENGYYAIQDRGFFNLYTIQEVRQKYKVSKDRGKYVRVGYPRTFLYNETSFIQYCGVKEVGAYKFNQISSNPEFILDSKKYNNEFTLYY